MNAQGATSQMKHRRRRSSSPGLLAPCAPRCSNDGENEGGADANSSCETCPVPCSVLEETARYLSDRVSETWAGISAAITQRRSDLDEVLDRLVGMGADGSAKADGGQPICTLVVSASEPARAALAGRMKEDPRFTVAGEASSPAAAVPLAATSLPDLVLVHLPDLGRRSLAELSELAEWSVNSVVVVVSGLDVVQVGDLMLRSGVADGWPRRKASRTGTGRRPGGGGSGRAPGGEVAGRLDPPRSIIQEAMRQIGVPMRRKP